MNQFTISLVGTLPDAAAINNFVDAIGNLWVMSSLHIVSEDLTPAGVDTVKFQFLCPYDFELPPDVANVVYYRKSLDDSRMTQRLTSFQKPILTQGDFVVALADVTLEGELSDYLQIPVAVHGANFQLWLGQGSSSETDFYTPFTTAAGAKYFNKIVAQGVRQQVVASQKRSAQKAIAGTAQVQ